MSLTHWTIRTVRRKWHWKWILPIMVLFKYWNNLDETFRPSISIDEWHWKSMIRSTVQLNYLYGLDYMSSHPAFIEYNMKGELLRHSSVELSKSFYTDVLMSTVNEESQRIWTALIIVLIDYSGDWKKTSSFPKVKRKSRVKPSVLTRILCDYSDEFNGLWRRLTSDQITQERKYPNQRCIQLLSQLKWHVLSFIIDRWIYKR